MWHDNHRPGYRRITDRADPPADPSHRSTGAA
jgi:hypothetical protein